jgi:hypothetical protein
MDQCRNRTERRQYDCLTAAPADLCRKVQKKYLRKRNQGKKRRGRWEEEEDVKGKRCRVAYCRRLLVGQRKAVKTVDTESISKQLKKKSAENCYPVGRKQSRTTTTATTTAAISISLFGRTLTRNINEAQMEKINYIFLRLSIETCSLRSSERPERPSMEIKKEKKSRHKSCNGGSGGRTGGGDGGDPEKSQVDWSLLNRLSRICTTSTDEKTFYFHFPL